MRRMLSIRMICCLVLVIFSLQSLLPGMSAGSEVNASEKKEMVWKQKKIVQIKKARQLIGETVTVSGIVTADQSAVGNGKLSTYIQDKSAGINVYSAQPKHFPELKAGMKVTVTGKITSYKGLIEIVPDQGSLKIDAVNQTLPKAKRVSVKQLETEQAGKHEGRLVKLKGYVEAKPAQPAGGGYNVGIIDKKYHSTTLRVMVDTNAIDKVKTGKWYEFTGVLSRYDTLQVLPRHKDDINLLKRQPKPPKMKKEYKATVDRVVDGDTIHLKKPVLGTTKVRFVNMDTPETYHQPKSELDKNQLRFGQQATDYLKTLLSSGDKVTLKIGPEAKDNYGRLLAQVKTKKGLNTNLELVKKGYAPTYFIWPVGDEKDYHTYQKAVKEAKEKELGIWNEADPLLEQPFEFRAREQKKGLTRYVGDSSVKTYVSPDKWKEIDVDKRIFFASKEEAEQAGYQPVKDADDVPLTILSMNDLHGKIDQEYELDLKGDGNKGMYGRMDYVAAYMKQKQAAHKNTITVHAGDMIGGSSPISSLLQDEPTIELMENIGFDVGTVGNHEFDEGVDELLRILNGGDHPKGTKGYDGQNFPLVCANCEYKDTGKPLLPAYEIIDVDGIPVAFIGVVTKSAAGMVMPEGIKDIQFTDEVKAVNEAAKELKQKGIKAIGVLAHMTASQNGDIITGESAKLAKEGDDEIDVIFAGHNHEVVNGEVNGKLIVQAFEYGKAIGEVNVTLDRKTKDIVKKSAEIQYIDQAGIKKDKEAADILAHYGKEVEPIISEVVGEAGVQMEGGYSNDGDTPLGNLIADGMRYSMKSDFAMMNGGGIRQNLEKGPITWGDLFNIQPFGNVLVKLEIKGKDLVEIIEAQISSQFGPDYSISGFSYSYDPVTYKVVDLKLPDGSAVALDQTYTLTVNNFMATATGSKYAPIGRLGQNPETGPEDLEATVDFVKSFEGASIVYQKEGRIQKAKQEEKAAS
ncbi:5'-nucleotidase C-terminal domain-containing protein [Bacillus pumilus]|uniref:5'-nucleotidase C-terminal domain-containing protein n=1 Tax=Bacillus pumilus TaxID=1408 RepID=UPI000717679F|nr:5'-nucleotidase C-terminal domain-containing protein [Bacillus pumilus]KRU17313.1 endonuclease [Bacillus pumilus]MCY7679073.1 5'-nucleotidase C-terminal domain-containing protein [Bacillus pumilus]